jgi:hypothetical protein
MMKKRIAILSLCLLFLVSTTGLPVTYHLCEMMQEKSLNECEICVVEVQITETTCCNEEISSLLLQISTTESKCCVESFTYNKIEDNFSYTSTLNTVTHCVVAILKPLELETKEVTIFSHQKSFNLPPPKFGRQLLHSIHQLKIDFPSC